ncbi:MAG: F0F1 ATP synthase subunit B [Candidatus Omnitrophica bacterium]|nr:F0F1 ATP synthase subunit B [Candidatus Omnitrophota bacterium]MBI5024591.1 F0F1 ATP synthase subunit B [Candidatus Omnitrophota bacterium]
MTNAVILTDPQTTPLAATEPSLLSPDVGMVALTWITFLLLSVVLYKFAWTPILKALDDREELLRRSVENADKIKAELDQLHQTRNQFIHEAEEKARNIISEAKQAGTQLSRVIQDKAREEAGILLENTRRDIKEEIAKAKIVLREESAQIAIELAGKLIEKNLDTESNRKLIHKLTAEV